MLKELTKKAKAIGRVGKSLGNDVLDKYKIKDKLKSLKEKYEDELAELDNQEKEELKARIEELKQELKEVK